MVRCWNLDDQRSESGVEKMPAYDQSSNEVTFKIVYFGPGVAGKTTNIQYIHRSKVYQSKGKIVATYDEKLGHILLSEVIPSLTFQGSNVKLQLMARVGSSIYKPGWQYVLQNVDGVVFVADSQTGRMDANSEFLYLLEHFLIQQNINFYRLPFVLQLNKRDCDEIASVAEMLQLLNPRQGPYFEAIARQGIGVVESLKSVVRQIMDQEKYTGKN